MNPDPLAKFSWFPESESLYARHLHEIVYSFVFYQVLASYIAPRLNRVVFGKHYTGIKDAKLKLDFDIHTVSMVQCLISCYLLWPVLFLPHTVSIASYTNEYCSMLTSVSAGYFIWDMIVCCTNYSLYGWQFVLHAAVALYGSLVPLSPMAQVWVPKFLLYEASTPFVNVNWFIMTLSKDRKRTVVPMWLNALNGLCLMAVFFSVRIVWGHIAQFIYLFQMWDQWHELPQKRAFVLGLLTIVLNLLNILWFSKMVKIARKLNAGPAKRLD
ncbi:Tda4p KNAG_0D01160 [Huiozyma naganishii CBS 8797]|uniref:TLC domain-containing protein n=1 Tax=Huiozyma naganishii (strain ATCC MYA-139 / BCRC 22969 / CBS 8797 / KCTC 17520 / NBRC 10181 / NCYC 3082 / Yp74L-3) TaxID=1071383 RepID=J7RK36_HUIN7|nr:hypothetical protein KNAG_0D01160 [Kazachstania naganishii CBS 8797]CCK69868.1 hypothetical protein KNAG_0D01160 [Kazachstania naganishii CBS 8797]